MIVGATDVYGDPLPVPFDVHLEGLGRDKPQVARQVLPGGRAEFEVNRHHVYRVRVVCEGHAEVARAVGGSVELVELAVPIDPSAVVGYAWPDPLPEIPGVTVPRVSWETLDDPRRATVLNIWAKLWATPIGIQPAAAYVETVLEVRPDRIIARCYESLEPRLAQAREDGVVRLVSGALHAAPAGYRDGPSYKTFDAHGNLQASLFFATDETPELGELVVDFDIDEARGFAHAFDVIGHAVTGDKTDPVEIHQILAAGGIDAGWRPRLA